MFSCDGEFPDTSNLNFSADENIPNIVLTKIGVDGMICMSGSDTTDVIIDLAGFVPAGSPMTALGAPVRVVDTRTSLGMTKLQPGAMQSFQPTGVDGIPADAAAVFYNLTALGRLDGGFIIAFPCGTPEPDTSTVNFGSNRNVPNFVVSKLGPDGVCVTSSVPVDVLVDIAGYVPSDAAGFELLDLPQRVFDTRNSIGGPAGKMVAGVARTIDAVVASAPTNAVAAIGNLTQAGPVGPGFATLYPCDVSEPDTSNLNWAAEAARANAVIVKLSAVGTLCVTSSAPTNLIFDVTGYITDVAFYTPVTPQRIYDSRQGWQAKCDAFATYRDAGLRILVPSTGAVRDVPVPPGFYAMGQTFYGPVFPTPDCTEFLGVDQGLVLHFPIDGSAAYTTSMGTRSDGSSYEIGQVITMLSDGSLVGATAAGELVNVETAQVLFTATLEPDDAYLAMSGDGRRVAYIESAFHSDSTLVLIDRFLPSELRLDIDPGFHSLEFSPDGRYLVLSQRSVDGTTETNSYVITPEGFIVEFIVDPNNAATARFAGNGSLWLCTLSGLYRWELFGKFELVAGDGSALFPESPVTISACL